MSEPQTPWQRRSDQIRRSPGWAVLLVTFGIFAVLNWGLRWLFPEVHLADGEGYYVAGLSLVVAIVLGGAYASGVHWGKAVRYTAIYSAIAIGLAIVYSLSHGATDLGARLRSALLPSEPVETGRNTLVLTENEHEEFDVTGMVNGSRVRFAVDTGASDIVLTPDDAQRVGIDVAALHFTGRTLTANGEGRTAYTHVSSLSVGSIRLDDVAVAVNSVPMETSLLGMSFLRRLKSFQIAGRTMTLTGQ